MLRSLLMHPDIASTGRAYTVVRTPEVEGNLQYIVDEDFTKSSGLDVGVGLSITAALHAKVALVLTPALSSGTFATTFLVLVRFAELQAVLVRNVR